MTNRNDNGFSGQDMKSGPENVLQYFNLTGKCSLSIESINHSMNSIEFQIKTQNYWKFT